MAKIHTVQNAQQRYKTKPVIDPATGQPKVRDTGRMTRPRHGRPARPITTAVTEADRTRPLPPETCEGCRQPIRPKSAGYPGDGYRWVQVKTGPYSSRRRVRHLGCGTWQPWELSNSLGAQLARVSHDLHAAIDSAETDDDVNEALAGAVSSVNEIAEAKRESAQNIIDGFGHDVPASDELNELADALEAWAIEIEGTGFPSIGDIDPDDVECPACDGEDPRAGCPVCGGDGTVASEEPSEDQLAEWRQEVEDALSVVDEVPV